MPRQVLGMPARHGKLCHTETVVDGLRQAPSAFINLLRGHNTGKMIVRL